MAKFFIAPTMIVLTIYFFFLKEVVIYNELCNVSSLERVL